MGNESTIRVAVFREEDRWVAQCLEVDIAVQAKTEEDLHYELGLTLVGRVLAADTLSIDPFEGLPRAPKRFWDMFRDARSQSQKVFSFLVAEKPLSRSIPSLELRAAA